MTIQRKRLNKLDIKYKYLYLTNTQELFFELHSNVSEFHKKINKRINEDTQIITNEYPDDFTNERIKGMIEELKLIGTKI
ncbi:hypothetical protein ENUP19_0143G0023 [Entamoeba nuttalli]|uniref:Uncharacterized protein n=1 Tax=Entamoeba nuttalli TaxID=412467 RepID=A0ABQ0DKH9_9EUKA